MENYNIAIDGPAGAGKSTVAKEIAKKLNYIYVDTGAMYRAMGLFYLNHNIDINNENTVYEHLDDIKIEICYTDGVQQIILNGENVTGLIRTEEVSQAASVVSKYKLVREKMVKLQQEIAHNNNVVMDGRDICEVVLPDARVKVFLTASSDERARRRYLEQKEKGLDVSLEEIKKDIEERDYRDSHRDNSPLRQAPDATLIDCSNMTIEDVVDSIIKLLSR